MLNSIMAAFGLSSTYSGNRFDQARISRYIRWQRLYDGFALRQNLSNHIQYKELDYNLALPIANASASFLAGKELSFAVADDDEATECLSDVWTESGGAATFFDAALQGTILGDAVAILQKKGEDECTCIRWLDPAVCFPEFDPHDYERMVALVIAYEIPIAASGHQSYYEEWRDGKVTIRIDDIITETDVYDQEKFNGVPGVWVRNQKIKNEIFGRSDLAPIAKLIERYDHLNDKQNRIIDYYSSPNLLVKGVKKGALEMTKGERTVYFVPETGDVSFIEWQGTAQAQAVEAQIVRTRETISEISETPQVAFSKIEGGMTDVTGIALKLLFGPLLKKTDRKRTTWGPALERLMIMALAAEGFEDIAQEDLSITWPDPLPQNLQEFWTIASMKKDVGVSKKQILREAEYSDEQIEEMEGEKEEEDAAAVELEAKAFAAGGGASAAVYPPGKDAPAKKPAPKPAAKE